MRLQWTASANRDLLRLYDFLKREDPRAALKAVKQLMESARQLPGYPHLGAQLDEFSQPDGSSRGKPPRDVRRIIAGDYELRYEVAGSDIYILRLWHCREDR
jgi:plasmid stabilization system protein ParE